jgi:hypothetical protein
MAQFVPFAPNVEVNGETVLATVNAFPEYMRKIALDILKKNGIENPAPGIWYSQKAWLDSFKEVSLKFGSNTLFEIGKAIPANAKFPPEINNIEKALASIDVAYKMNHRNGDIGFYKLVSHDANTKILVMNCKNPYPCDFDRGIITTMARKFKAGVVVKLDTTKPSRNEGAEDSWYIITY